MKTKKITIIIFIIVLVFLFSVITILLLNNVKLSKELNISLTKNNEKILSDIKEKDGKISLLEEKINVLKEENNEKWLEEVSQKDKKISLLEEENRKLKNKNNEQTEKIKDIENNNKTLLEELEEIKQNINKRVKINNSYRQTCTVGSDTITLFFNDLSNVEKIDFSINQDESNIIGINDNKKNIPVVLDKSQNKGVVSYWTYETVKLFNKKTNQVVETSNKRISSMNFEVYYIDGRTETITTNIGCG